MTTSSTVEACGCSGTSLLLSHQKCLYKTEHQALISGNVQVYNRKNKIFSNKMSDNTIVITTTGSVSYLYNVYIFDASGGNIVFTLGNAAITDGLNYKLKRKDTSINTVTIAGFNTSQLINGNVNEKLLIGGELNVTSIGGLWYGNTLNQSSGNVYLNGDGSETDQNLVISTNTDLTRDMYYNNLTVNSGVTLFTKGFRIFVKGTLNVNGVLNNAGQNGIFDGTAALGGIGGFTGTLGGGADGATAPSGGGISAGNNGNTVPTLSRIGGNGGAAGSSLDGGVGGSGGTSNNPATNSGGVHVIKSLPSILSGRDLDGVKLYGGNGGGSGGSGPQGNSSGGSGGGGGGGMIVSARIIKGTGAFTVNGGNGGTVTSPYTGGGGGGGGGGYMIILCGKNYIPSTSFTANGGFGGTAYTGSGGTAGGNGTVLIAQQ